jgi:hypothetical protein
MPISENIATAIEQLRPELPALLANDYSQFLAQLDAALAQGNEDQVRALFDEEKYPVLYDRLLKLLGRQGGDRGTTKVGDMLHGDSSVTLPSGYILHGDNQSGESRDLAQISERVKRGTLFYCSASRQLAELSPTTLAHPETAYLCPQHQQPLSKIHKDNIEVQMKKGKGYELLLYCATESHLVLMSPTDDLFSTDPRGNILCPEHHRKMHRIPEAIEGEGV